MSMAGIVQEMQEDDERLKAIGRIKNKLGLGLYTTTREAVKANEELHELLDQCAEYSARVKRENKEYYK